MTFEIRRQDGRSNGQVLLDYLKDGEPGRVYSYDELAAVLADGTGRYTRQTVQGMVRQIARRLSIEQSRAMVNVKHVGYKLALAAEHTSLALTHRRRSDSQLRRGLEILRHVRDDEMSLAQRQMHEGHLMITSALYANQRLMWKRQQETDKKIAALSARVDDIERKGD